MSLQDMEKFSEYKQNLKMVREVGFASDQNKHVRLHMEDKHIICDDIMNDGNIGLYGVLDGHGGIHVVDYCQKNIPLLFKAYYKPSCDIKNLFTEIFK